ncbi:MAG: C25 family cysteine peptidase, partial [candidate division WOR-3 bacterium]|nr:C25 family cysteine peptidase [candidate division WOR-3 bacterium]
MLKRKNGMFPIMICLLSYAGYSAGAWVPFTRGSVTPPQINLIESNSSKVSFSVEVCGMNSEDTLVEGTLYQKINIPDHWFYEETGFPKIPVVNVLLAIPDCDSAILSITPTDSLEYENYNVYPMPRFVGGEGSLLKEEFTKNDSIYSIDAYFPNSFGRIGELGAVREQKIVRVEIYPTQFNPVTHKLKVYTDYEVELTFTNPASGVNENTGIFSNICGNTILNYEFSGLNASVSVGTGEKGSVTRVTSIPNPWTGPACDYLIITYDDLFNSSYLDQIAYRRANYNGFDVVIVKVDDIYAGYPTSGDYWNEESIRNFIQSVYENGTANHTYDGKLGYVLLVGDANDDYKWPYEGEDKTGPPTAEYANHELVPTSYVYQHTAWIGGNERFEELGDASDYYYSCITEESGNYDDYPDIMIGRISVGNETELSTVADKIVNYEPMPLEASWRKNILLVGGGPRGGWDTWYSSDPEFNEIATNIFPTEYWTTYVTQHLPTSVPADEIFYDDVAADPHGYLYVRPFIADKLNEGQLITDYMGHGWAWDVQLLRPDELSNGDILNGDRLPFIFAMACEVGMFDLTEEGNTNTFLPYIPGVWDCAAEIYINNFVSGAVAYVAASRASYASSFGTIDGYAQEAIFKNHSYVLGEAVMEAKLKTTSLLYRRQYNFFGDPALNIMLEEPIGYTQDALATARNNQRKLAKNSNNKFHLVYQSQAGGNELIFHMTSTENEEWATRACIGQGKFPVLAIDNADGINVSWIAEEDKVSRLYYRKNNGTWGVPVVLLKEQSDYGVRFSSPAMVVDSNNIVHIVLTEVFWAAIQEEEKDSPGANTTWVLAPPGANTRWSLTYISYTPSSGAKETKKLDIVTIDGFKGLGNSIASIDIDMNSAPHIT